MDLKTLLSGDYTDTKVEWNDQVVMVTFDPVAYTPALEAQVLKAKASVGVVDLILKLVKDWDITDNDQPYPVNEDNVGALPLAFLVAVCQSIGEELAQDPLLRRNSEGPS